MLATASASKFAGFSSIAALCLLWGAQASAQSAGSPGSGGAANAGGAGDGAGAPSGGMSSGGMPASDGGAPASGGAPSGAAGMMSATGGAPSGAAGMSGEGTAGAPAMSTNLVTNGTFETTASPWWSNASSTDENPADITLAIADGQLCATMTAGGKNVWDEIIGLSGVALVKNQYYHVSFTVTADAPRKIKFKTGLGTAPYSDYFIEPVDVTATPTTATPQLVDYTYLNLRDDPMAQFQFQIGGTGGVVCVDNVVLEPVPAPATPAYTSPSHSHHPFKDYKGMVKMGTAVDTPIFLSNPLHNSIVAGEFAMITPANSMKMNLIQPTEGVFDYTDTDALAAWAKANNLEFRGHPLVWHTQTPSWLTSPETPWTRDQMIDIMYKHIDGLMGHYVGQFPYWDVVNEAVEVNQDTGVWGYRSTPWHDIIGDDFIELAFNHAHAADPSAELLYNDYNIEQKGNPKADYVFEMVKALKDKGVPIGGIGFQGHYFIEPDGTTSNGVPDMQAIRDNMARYDELGIDVQITECDFRIGKPLTDMKTDVQNKFYADMLQACIDAPNCSHFTVWGLSDLDSWVPGTFADYDYAHLWDTALMPKADYFAMTDVFAKYNTDGSLIGGNMGTAGATGMLGGAGTTGGAGMPAGTGMMGGSSPAAAEKKSGGGCAVTPGSNQPGAWLGSALALLGVLVSRRRRKG
jgi:endo-1,4-beta-xylanase